MPDSPHFLSGLGTGIGWVMRPVWAYTKLLEVFFTYVKTLYKEIVLEFESGVACGYCHN